MTGFLLEMSFSARLVAPTSFEVVTFFSRAEIAPWESVTMFMGMSGGT